MLEEGLPAMTLRRLAKAAYC